MAFFSAILENLLESFFRKVKKLCVFAKMANFPTYAKFGQMNIFLKKGLCYLLTLIVPQLHAKIRKNPLSGLRDRLHDGRTD